MRPKIRHKDAHRNPANSAPSMLPMKLQLAIALHQRGQFPQARRIYEEILRIEPKNFDALHLLGVIAAQSKDSKRAVQLFDKAIKINPAHAPLHCNRGTAMQDLGLLDAALASYDRAIAIKPDYAIAYSNRGNVLKEKRDWAAALASFERAIALKTDFAEAYSNRGTVLGELGQWDAALTSFDAALAIKADYAQAHCNRGNALNALGRFDRALLAYDQAIALKGDYAEAFYNRGNVLKQLRQLDAALASYEHAIAIKTDYAEAYLNRGYVLKELQRLDEALLSYDEAIRARPDFAEAHVNRAVVLLSRGDFAQGFNEYEWRWRNHNGPNIHELRNFRQPLWTGKEPIAGRTILLHGEQGFGDTLQFCRYATVVSNSGATVLLETQAPVVQLLAGLAGVSQVIARGDLKQDFDFHCPLLSLPLACNTRLDSIPSPGRYLGADAAKVAYWQEKLGDNSVPRIGLAWSGNSRHSNDCNRGLALAALIQFLPRGFHYISLQKDLREADRDTLLANEAILNMTHELADFSDTAALCECLDLVISVDTSVAHLSGALGTKTWVLLARNADWRWLLDREDSPWYSSVTLYRQAHGGDWVGVLERVAAALTRTF
jgi:tetratricopeptide (TPR) repeat protein